MLANDVPTPAPSTAPVRDIPAVQLVPVDLIAVG
jgi:hypothetical protein